MGLLGVAAMASGERVGLLVCYQPLETRYSRIDASSSVEIATAGLYAAAVDLLLLLPALDAAAGASVPQKRRAQKAL